MTKCVVAAKKKSAISKSGSGGRRGRFWRMLGKKALRRRGLFKGKFRNIQTEGYYFLVEHC